MDKPERYLLLAQKALFQIFIFLIPTQLGYHIWPSFSFIFGIRVDYFALTIYLTDFILIAIFGLFFLETIVNKKKPSRKFLTALVILFSFAAINLLFSTSSAIAFYKWVKVFELFLLGAYVVFQNKLKFFSWVLLPLLISTILFSLIGIGQFILQKSINGPLYYFGERSFNSLTPGIALGSIIDRLVLRAYSTFSHPNSFAGFLGVGGIIVYYFSPKTKREKIIKILALFLIALALALTLSRWVFVSILLCLIVFVLQRNNPRLFKKNTQTLVVSAIIISLIFPFLSNVLLTKGITFSESFTERLIWADRAGEMFAKNPLIGTGLNNYILKLPEAGLNPVVWKLQPVHNILLLILTETGLIGLGLFSIVIMVALKRAVSFTKEKRSVFWVIVFIVISGLADHYWLTLQQNQILLALFLGLSLKKTGT